MSWFGVGNVPVSFPVMPPPLAEHLMGRGRVSGSRPRGGTNGGSVADPERLMQMVGVWYR